MYSSSNGQPLSTLPDLDDQQTIPRESLKKRTNVAITTMMDDGSSSSSNKTSSSLKSKSGRGKKPEQELLSEAQKKANHIASEQKRRANIRMGFDQLVDIIPTLSHCHRSESLILQKSYDYIQQLQNTKTNLKDRIRELQLLLGDIPDEDSSEEEDECIL
ncbi:uncharacterized protein BX664DRAFT_344924 [Halteromyces radiatus]|uniref:uncharacterized protein n=1 Tax=Halteromyces radiatus TaxID=101107 RepID=UPI00221F6B3D|nr:uncharacterized protein BX664DRAFT_344924 [Halteromyces radiatus]KAI8098785.1 hypothetical protein BX664DRAFT_344924 [Halteromyces radiatus]